MQICALACVKLSFIFFYRRIFCTGNGKVFSAITIAMIVIIIAWAVSFNIALLFICNGYFAAMWTSIQDLNAHCGNLLDWQLGYAISDFITDVMVLVLPMPRVHWIFFHLLHCNFGILTAYSDMEASAIYHPQTRYHWNILFWRSVSSEKKGIETWISWLRRRTIAASITRMVIFIRAVEDLKVEYRHARANNRECIL